MSKPNWVESLIIECRAIALAACPQHPFAVQTIPVKLLTRRSRRAGTFNGIRFCGTPNLGYININIKLCHTPERFKSTLLHEFAHAMVHWDGRRELGDSHGPRWISYMVKMGQPPERCHDYDLQEAFGDYYTRVACKAGHEVTLKPSHVSKMKRGLATYHCRKCGPKSDPIELPRDKFELPAK